MDQQLNRVVTESMISLPSVVSPSKTTPNITSHTSVVCSERSARSLRRGMGGQRETRIERWSARAGTEWSCIEWSLCSYCVSDQTEWVLSVAAVAVMAVVSVVRTDPPRDHTHQTPYAPLQAIHTSIRTHTIPNTRACTAHTPLSPTSAHAFATALYYRVHQHMK